MDFRSLLQSMNTISEGDVVHKGTYGTSHGSEDVRDQYGHKIGKVNKDAKAAKPAEKRGRGRPKKGSDETGEVKKYDFTAFGGGKKVNLPKWDKSKTTKHSLKEYIEEVEQQTQQLDEVAQQLTIAPAQQSTQVIKQGNKTLGTVENPQLANQIKQAIGQGQMTLNPNDQEMAEDGGEKWIQKAVKHPGALTKKAQSAGMSTQAFAKKHAHDSGKTGKQARLAITLNKMHESKEIKESVSISENHETLQHIISKFKHEVKNFMNGGELDPELYDALFDYYLSSGEMPYGVAKARTGDPEQWVFDRLQQDLPEHVEEGNFTTHGMNSGPRSMEPNARMANKLSDKPVQNPTPWGTDPINAATDRAINFISGLRKPKQNPFEGKDMKDVQLESWESQLNSLLTEGITVSSSQGQQGAPDSVSVNATDSDAQQLLQVLRQAGVGVFGGHDHQVNGISVPASPEGEPAGNGTSPEQAPAVAGDDGDILALIKKMTGIEGGSQPAQAAPAATADYEEEGGEEGQEQGEDQGEEQTDEGNAFTGALAKAKQDGVQPGEKMDVDGDGDKETPVKEDDMEEGNMFTGNLAKARAQGKEQADLDGDGDMEKVHEGEEETCNECGMYESECGCDHEQVEENFANDAGGDAMGDTELAKLKTLLSMGNDMHKLKHDQTVGNPAKVTISVQESLTDWKKLSGIK